MQECEGSLNGVRGVKNWFYGLVLWLSRDKALVLARK